MNLAQFRTDHVEGPFRWPAEVDLERFYSLHQSTQASLKDYTSSTKRASAKRILAFLTDTLTTSNVISANLEVDIGSVRKTLRRLEAKRLAERVPARGEHFWRLSSKTAEAQI